MLNPVVLGTYKILMKKKTKKNKHSTCVAGKQAVFMKIWPKTQLPLTVLFTLTAFTDQVYFLLTFIGGEKKNTFLQHRELLAGEKPKQASHLIPSR